MWNSYLIGICVCVILLYGPGFLLFRSLGFKALRALILAPIASLSTFCLLGIILTKAGIACTWINVALAPLLIFLVIFLARFRKIQGQQGSEAQRDEWLSLGLYLFFGLVIGVYVYVASLGSPETFLQEYDNAFHLQVTRAFFDSGSWSVLDVSKYLTAADMDMAPFSSTGFYPALWHLLGALIMGLLGCSVMLSVNVVNFVLPCILFPAGMMLLLSVIFRDKRTVRLGAVCSLAFVAFPWMMLYWGPLYANVSALCLTPLASSLFIMGVNGLLEGTFKLRVLFAFLLSVFLLVVSQTSAVFFCVAFLAPYCVYRLWTLEHRVEFGARDISGRTFAIGFAIFTLVVWSALAFAPFMYNVVFDFNWPATMNLGEALLAVLLLRVGWVPSQFVLAIVVIVGLISTIRHRQYLWLLIPYGFFAVTYVLCASTEGFAKHFLGGFWYTDPFRILACLALTGIPLAAQGLSSITRFLGERMGKRPKASLVAMGAFLIVFCVFVYRPGVWLNGTYVDSAFGKMRWEFKQGNDSDRPILYDAAEQRFVEEVLKVIPEDSVVLNMPDDGSAFVYATSGIRTFYRDYRDYEGSSDAESQSSHESEESQLLRQGANRIATDEDVQEVFRKLGIQYVLVLDYGDSLAQQPKVSTYEEDLWTGIAGITDDTPGFSIVLSEGDMRLYKVEM